MTTAGEFPPGGVVRALGEAGHGVLRTYNEARSRLASDEELAVFGTDPALQPLDGRLVIEIIHGTFGLDNEPLEVVMSIRPATDNVIVFETYGEGEDDELARQAGSNPASP